MFRYRYLCSRPAEPWHRSNPPPRRLLFCFSLRNAVFQSMSSHIARIESAIRAHILDNEEDFLGSVGGVSELSRRTEEFRDGVRELRRSFARVRCPPCLCFVPRTIAVPRLRVGYCCSLPGPAVVQRSPGMAHHFFKNVLNSTIVLSQSLVYLLVIFFVSLLQRQLVRATPPTLNNFLM